MQNILIIYYFAISQKFSKIVFENENLAIFAGNSQKFSCPPYIFLESRHGYPFNYSGMIRHITFTIGCIIISMHCILED